MERLRNDFLPSDLHVEIDEFDISGVITVQARQTLEETKWLLELAGQRGFIKGVVGWAPLASPEIGAVLEELAGAAKLRGLRHVLHDEKDDQYMLRHDFNEGIARLREHNLVYESSSSSATCRRPSSSWTATPSSHSCSTTSASR